MSLLEAHSALAGKRAVLLGGSGGIGRTIALALADAGVDIASCDIDEEAAREIVPEVEARGRRIVSFVGDVTVPQQLDAFYDKVETEFGSADIVVHVVGGVKRRPFLDGDRERDQGEIQLNYGYIVDSFRRAIPLIRKGGRGGTIVSFTTIEAHRGAATYSVYAGAKAATTNFSKAMACELAAEGIRVNIIAPDTTPSRNTYSSGMPGLMPKEMVATLAEASKDALGIYVPQKKPPTQQDLANGVLFLVSDLARSITGVVLHIDGGASAAAGFIDWPHGGGWGPAPQAGSLDRLVAPE
jgi:NAD(P)-dependent dehydrogenase (short-subunit alcohol dehydrogenase family)